MYVVFVNFGFLVYNYISFKKIKGGLCFIVQHTQVDRVTNENYLRIQCYLLHLRFEIEIDFYFDNFFFSFPKTIIYLASIII